MRKMSGLHFALACRELASLQGKRIARIRKTEDGIYLFKIGGEEVLFEPGVRLHLTRLQLSAAEKPDGFVSYLRKRLEGKTAQEIRQHGNDRIAEICARSKERLVLELFRKGNIILVSESGIIEACLKSEEAGGRRIAKGEIYRYPEPTGFQLEFPKEIAFSVQENEKGEAVSFSCDAKDAGRRFGSLSEALDYYYAHAKKESPAEKALKEKLERLRRRIEEQEKAIGELSKRRQEARMAAEAIYRNFGLVEEAIGLARRMKKEGASEEEINRELCGRKARLRGAQLEIELED
ncbi:MAG: NFACT family protein [Candidatus Micrarchaeota archaeon]|nr:NFACT family protein [Candidatus Micrarchaeota archaeon]